MKTSGPTIKRKSNWMLLLRIVVALAVVAAVFLGGRKLIMRKRADLAKSPEFRLDATPVETARAFKGDLMEGHQYLAGIEPYQTADVSARVTGTIIEVMHREGDEVKAGEVLAILDDRAIRDAIAVVEAQIEQVNAEGAANRATLESMRKTSAYWQNEVARYEGAAGKGAIARVEATRVVEQLNEAKGRELNAEKQSLVILQRGKTLQRQIDELKTTLAYHTLKSPFDGVVSARLADVGDLAVPGKSLLTMEDRSAVKVAFDVPQSDLPAVKVGIAASFDYAGKAYRGTVNRLYPKLNRARMLRAEVVLKREEAADLPLGAYITLSVEFSQHQDVVLVPTDSIVDSGSGISVFTMADGVLHRCPIRRLGTACGTTAVEGIEPGDEVVVHSFLGWARLADGMNVEAKP